jgi:FMN reductase
MGTQLHIVGIGGTTVSASSTEQALTIAMRAAERAGAAIQIIDCVALARLPHFKAGQSDMSEAAAELLAAVRKAHGLMIASPAYHGSISGVIKNAIDYFEHTAKDPRPYLDGLPVGLIATSYGWQAAGSSLNTLRSIVHSLRGWPTPLGAAINCSGGVFQNGACSDVAVTQQLELIGRQVVEFARLQLGRVPA